jgi:hypothetical protein
MTKRAMSVAMIIRDKTGKKKKVAIRKLSAPKDYILTTWNVDNFSRLLNNSLQKECHANIIHHSFNNDTMIRWPITFEAPVLGEDMLAAAKIRATDALKVST